MNDEPMNEPTSAPTEAIASAMTNLEKGLRFFQFQDHASGPLFGWTVLRGPWFPGLNKPIAAQGHRAGITMLRYAAALLSGAPQFGRTKDNKLVIDLEAVSRADADSRYDGSDGQWQCADPIRDAFTMRQKYETACALLERHLAPRSGKQAQRDRGRLVQETRTFLSSFDDRAALWRQTAELWGEAWELLHRCAAVPALNGRIEAWLVQVEKFMGEINPELNLTRERPFELFSKADLERACSKVKTHYEAALRAALDKIEDTDPTDDVAKQIREVLSLAPTT